ncbi:MAG: hypothetical protein JW791_03100 [Nanoarchaeota archaeon]|nr:hypothetical protein [Nanoarchaeota archaeon]
MVYINSLNAFYGVGLILLLSTFVILVGYLWVNNLKEEIQVSLEEELESHVCNCLDIISDNDVQLVVMNVNCLYVENLSITAGNEVHTVEDTLYYEDFAVIEYDYQPLFFNFTYNNCTEYFNK